MIADYRENILFFDDLNLLDFALLNQTPFYLYSEKTILNNYNSYVDSFANHDHLLCYSVKANSNLSILSLLAKLNSGFDIVSAGELSRVIEAGGDPSKTVFSGVGKTEDEIRFALDKKIMCFNIESLEELATINKIALEHNTVANISIRVNPSIDAKTHPYITTGLKDNKFGIDESEVINAYKEASKLKGLNIFGIDFHIGSQIMDVAPYKDSLLKIIKIINELKKLNINITHIDIGGGLGISYTDEKAPSKTEFVKSLTDALKTLNLTIIIEPGRSIVGNSGLLVTKIINVKSTPTKKFIIVDAGMNDFIRPPLYGAYHSIKEIFLSDIEKFKCDVVGPICETTDFFGKDRLLGASKGDFLVIEDTGAYGSVFASNYNTRPKIAEYLVKGNNAVLIKSRETVENILANEKSLLK